ALLITLTAGLVWQALLVAGLVAAEQRTLRFSVVRQALWLQRPTSPRTGRKGGRLWLLTIPLILAFGAAHELPTPSHPAGRDLAMVLDTPAGEALFHGGWGWYALVVAMGLFNTVLGEELLFRGYLLPRMGGVFGRADWLADGVIFALYHLHVPWGMPSAPIRTHAPPLSCPPPSPPRPGTPGFGLLPPTPQTLVVTLLVLPSVLEGAGGRRETPRPPAPPPPGPPPPWKSKTRAAPPPGAARRRR